MDKDQIAKDIEEFIKRLLILGLTVEAAGDIVKEIHYHGFKLGSTLH